MNRASQKVLKLNKCHQTSPYDYMCACITELKVMCIHVSIIVHYVFIQVI